MGVLMARNALPSSVIAWAPSSLPEAGVERFGGIFGGRPPVLVIAIPLNGRSEAVLEVTISRPPPEFVAQFGRVDGVPQIMTGPVRDIVVCVSILTHDRQDQLDNSLVVLFAVRADEIRLSDSAIFQDL